MSFRKTISWILSPLTVWYAIGVGFRNLLFDLGIKRQVVAKATTIGVGNICAGGAGKTPHVEYLLRLLSDKYATALLSRGYRRRTSGFQLDDGSHSATHLGDEPSMIANKFPQVTVAVCEKRVAGVEKLLQLQRPPQLIILDDAYQHRYIKPTLNILLTEYDNPYCNDHILPFGNLRESRRARYRANIVIVTKSPEKLNPIDKHNLVNRLGLKPFQKVFFSYIHYCDPLPLMGNVPLPLQTVESVLLVTGIAHPEPMEQHVKQYSEVTPMRFNDHHRFTLSDIKRIRKAFGQLKGNRKLILTTEKDAARLRELSDNEAMAGLPIYYLPIEVRIHQNKDLNFDYTVQNIVQDNILFQERMKNAKFDF
ncbi:MAG: tetraacyldisaccharide 4'-kinase [Bacteroidales bacterium]|nr:tetraacyldisaccharide 4'-kinase [Bacteroidales bacterium]